MSHPITEPFAERRRKSPRLLFACLLLGSALVTSCASAGKFIWYSELPRSEWAAASGEYVIGVGDGIDVRVYQQEEVSGGFKVRSDGRIALPLAGEIVVAGKHPSALARELEGLLKPYIVVPRVTVNVTDPRPVSVVTMGEISSKGALTIDKPARLVQALAQSGGLTEFADEDRIFVIRQFPAFQRIRFTYEAIMNNIDNAGTFPLRTGDMIVVE